MQHILLGHGSWLIQKYGSLALWNAQGMERSHWQARSGYLKGTRHGGGIGGSNAYKELFIRWFRTMKGRQDMQDKIRNCKALNVEKENRKRKHREAWQRSNAREKHLQWQQSKRRVGKTWVPLTEQAL